MWGLKPESGLAPERQLGELARAHRILALNGHVNMTLGHLSWRDPEGRGFWLKRSGLGFEEIGRGDFILLDFAGNHIAGTGKRHAEWPIHAEIFKARPDVEVIAHSHPFHAAVFSACDVPLKGVCQEGIILHDKVAYYRVAQGLIRSPEQGRDLAAVLGKNAVVLMKNHGITTCGPTIAAATLAAIFVERACSAQLLAAASRYDWTGPAAEDLSEGGGARLELSPHLVEDLWHYFGRQIDRHERRSSESV